MFKFYFTSDCVFENITVRAESLVDAINNLLAFTLGSAVPFISKVENLNNI